MVRAQDCCLINSLLIKQLMKTIILDNISLESDGEYLRRKLKTCENKVSRQILFSLFEEARRVTRAKAIYHRFDIEDRAEDATMVAGRWIKSRALAVNLRDTHQVFVFMVTCGIELEEWADGKKGLLETFLADVIKEIALQTALRALEHHIEKHHFLGKTARQLPGSLEDFPIAEQKTLFSLMGDTKTAIGLTLLPSLMMFPTHSIAGVIFPSKDDFESCMLCPRKGCPNRRFPHDQNLWRRKYSQSSGKIES